MVPGFLTFMFAIVVLGKIFIVPRPREHGNRVHPNFKNNFEEHSLKSGRFGRN